MAKIFVSWLFILFAACLVWAFAGLEQAVYTVVSGTSGAVLGAAVYQAVDE